MTILRSDLDVWKGEYDPMTEGKPQKLSQAVVDEVASIEFA